MTGRALAIVLLVAATAAGGLGCKRRHRLGFHLPGAKRAPVASVVPMVWIPEGRFDMGVAGEREATPVHEEHVSGFWMQRLPVTVAEYAKCQAMGVCTGTPEKPYCNEHEPNRLNHPMNCVTWEQAKAFCGWAGARLPTEVEWEYAARGTDGRRYPWGDEKPSAARLCWDGKDSDLGMMKRRGTCAVGAHPAGASPFGLLDMAGNVWEWTVDLYSETYDADRLGPKRVVRGGTWFGFDARDVRSGYRFKERPDIEDYGTGFRCARGGG